jgi:hypothetical protein
MPRAIISGRVAAAMMWAQLAAFGCGGDAVSTAAAPPLPLALQTAHYSFYCASGDGVDAGWQEAYHEWATARLGVRLPGRIGYYKYRSRQEMGVHTGRYNTNGYSDAARLEIHTLWATDNHEVVHLFMSTIGQSSALFSEGVAVAFQADPVHGAYESVFNGEEVHRSARRYLDAGSLVLPLDRIVETKGFRAVSDEVLAYREAGSFVRFLIDGYGLDRLLAFYRSGTSPDETREAIKGHFNTTFGVAFEEAEAEWLDMLRTAI